MEISQAEHFKVKTRAGADAVIYNMDGGGTLPIHGAVWNGVYWDIRRWLQGGNVYPMEHHPDDIDWDGSLSGT